MIYVINGKSALKTNKDIIQYINSHKDKKYIILVDNTKSPLKKIKGLRINFLYRYLTHVHQFLQASTIQVLQDSLQRVQAR